MSKALSIIQRANALEENQSLLHLVEEKLAHKLSKSTRDMYKRDVANYQMFAHANLLEPFEPTTFEAWRDAMVLHPTTSPNTINRMMSAVKTVINKAAQKGMVTKDIAGRFEKTEGVALKANKGKLKKHSRTRIEKEDMRRMCELPDASTLMGKRDKALLATLASSGVRADELATLSTSQMIKQGKGYILKVQGKTDIEFRDTHLSVEAYDLIQVWLEARPVLSQFIFTRFDGRGETRLSIEHISSTAVWNIVTKYAKQAGLAHIKPHDFRRFVGTQLAAKDIRKAQLALGHKSIEVTARHYVLDKLTEGETDNLY